MPYYHKGCGGQISILTRKCKKCGHRWGIMAWFSYPPPRNMTKYVVEAKAPSVKKGKTTYAKWADKPDMLPGVGWVASHMPRIKQRWARILIVACVITALVLIINLR